MARQLGVHGKLSRRVTAVLAVCLAIFPALGASAQSEVTRDDIAEADANRRAISAELEAATIEYDTAVARLIELEDSLTTLGIELAALEQDLALARVAAQEVATDRYVYAGSTQSALFGSTSIDDVRVRTSYLDILSRAGTDIVLRLFALEESYEAQEANVALALENQEETSVELEAMAASILTQLEEANSEYNTVVAAFEKQEEERRAREEAERLRREEEERRRLATSTTVATTSTTGAPGDTTTTAVTTTTAPPTTTPPPPSGSLACPVNGAVAFTDTWGAPRSGGRSHKGVDMIAARGTPLVAIEAGTIKRLRNSGLGGITVVLAGASGDEFYYAHLDGWAPGLSAGQSVAVGELIGYVGNTGNAQYTVPHLHFEHSPGGNGAVNPYPLVAGLCL